MARSYNTNNMLVSLTLDLAQHLRDHGYAVRWHATGDVDPPTTGPLSSARGEITLVPSFPANPALIVGLRDENTRADNVVVPALALCLPDAPKRKAIAGLGHREWEWLREVHVDALAVDEFQHRELADLLHDWFESEANKPLPISDYGADSSTPTPLEPVRVDVSAVTRNEQIHEVEAIRYQIRAMAVLSYYE